MQIFIARRRESALVLALAPDGYPELAEPQPTLVKATYVPSTGTSGDLSYAGNILEGDDAALMLALPSLDGPPFRTAVLFAHPQRAAIPWRHGTRGHPKVSALKYVATSPKDTAAIWHTDIVQKTFGYFLTGQASATSLWRIVRIETDAANRYLFTLRSVELPHGLPSADISSIEDAGFRAEVEQHWGELEDHLVHHRSYALVTAAKNVAEALAVYYLSRSSPSRKRTFDATIKEIGRHIEGKSGALPFTALDYHLMQKLRMLHARTHPERAVVEGRRLEPEFALTAAQDLVEVLRSLGLVQAPG